MMERLGMMILDLAQIMFGGVIVRLGSMRVPRIDMDVYLRNLRHVVKDLMMQMLGNFVCIINRHVTINGNGHRHV